MRLLVGIIMLVALSFAQTQAGGTSSPYSGIGEYGLPTGIAGLVLYFWRQDRRDREEQRKADSQRYEALAQDFRQIVTDNTAAITSLKDSLAGRIVQCPFSGNAHN